MGKKKDKDDGSPSFRKKPKKNKKHKRKHERLSDGEEIDVVNNDLNEGKGLKLKIKFGGRTLSTTELVSDTTADEDLNIESAEEEIIVEEEIEELEEEEVEEEIEEVEDIDEVEEDEVVEDEVAEEEVVEDEVVEDEVVEDEVVEEGEETKQDKPSSSKRKKRDDEEQWLEALDKGELDDNGELKKGKKDFGLMTARQRALHGDVSKEHMETLQQLPMYPERTEEENEEIERKKQLRAKKRRQQMQKQIEQTKAQTVEKLLTKGQKNKKDTKIQRKLGDHVRYLANQNGFSLSYTEGLEFPFERQKPVNAPSPVTCAVNGCQNIKKYSCSTTKLPVCSLQCYKEINYLYGQRTM